MLAIHSSMGLDKYAMFQDTVRYRKSKKYQGISKEVKQWLVFRVRSLRTSQFYWMDETRVFQLIQKFEYAYDKAGRNTLKDKDSSTMSWNTCCYGNNSLATMVTGKNFFSNHVSFTLKLARYVDRSIGLYLYGIRSNLEL